MFNYTVVDAHCDTVSEIYQNTNLYQSAGHIDIKRMAHYQGWIQFFAIWIDPKYDPYQATGQFEKILGKYERELAQNIQYIEKVTNYSQICDVLGRGKNAALLSLEGGDIIGSHADGVNALYKKGIRCIALTWNNTNQLASGSGDTVPEYGLTPLGIQVVERMNELGMIVDVSHLSDKAFFDVARVCKGPFIATHSNARAVCGHRRNLTDEQFTLLKQSGGVVGINLYPLFLSGSRKAGLGDVVAHIEHFCSLGGQDNIGMGADFDGIDTLPEGILGMEHVGLIFEELLRLNYSEGLVKGLASENFLRVIKNILS